MGPAPVLQWRGGKYLGGGRPGKQHRKPRRHGGRRPVQKILKGKEWGFDKKYGGEGGRYPEKIKPDASVKKLPEKRKRPERG